MSPKSIFEAFIAFIREMTPQRAITIIALASVAMMMSMILTLWMERHVKQGSPVVLVQAAEISGNPHPVASPSHVDALPRTSQ